MIRRFIAAVTAAAALGSAGVASASLNFVSAGGNFQNPAGAGGAVLEDLDGLLGSEFFRFGEIGLPGTTVQSFLSFTSAGAVAVNPGETFALGSLQYRNGAN